MKESLGLELMTRWPHSLRGSSQAVPHGTSVHAMKTWASPAGETQVWTLDVVSSADLPSE